MLCGVAKMDVQQPLIKPGRPRLEVDSALILRLRDEEYFGWSRGAEQYRERTGQWISRDTFKRRYYEAKAVSEPAPTKAAEPKVIIKSPLEKIIEEWEQIIKKM